MIKNNMDSFIFMFFLVSRNNLFNDCVIKLSQIDNSINWKLRSDKIANYIRYRRNADLEKIAIEDSSYSVLIYPWVEYYKNFYHKKEYVKNPKWDWVGVTTLFTFYWDITIETILFAKTMVKDIKNLMVGGVLASIQAKEIEEATGIKPHCGTLHTPYKDIDSDNPYIIDGIPAKLSVANLIAFTIFPFLAYSCKYIADKIPIGVAIAIESKTVYTVVTIIGSIPPLPSAE